MPWRVPRKCNEHTDGLSGNARNRLVSVLRFFFANAGSGRSCVACAHVLGLSSLAPGLPLAFSSACPAAHTGSDRLSCARACMPLLCTGCRIADRPSLWSRHRPLVLQRVAPSACLAARPGRTQPPSLPDPGPALRTAPSAVVRATQTRLARNVYSINVCTPNTSPHQTYVTARAQISNSAQGIISTHGIGNNA